MKEARSYRTKQREMVLQFFSAHPGKCFCAKELIAQKSIPVGSATLYRTLALLCQEGKLKKYTDVSGNSAFYQYNESDSCHYHFHLNTKYLFTIISEQAENFCPLPQIPTTTI